MLCFDILLNKEKDLLKMSIKETQQNKSATRATLFSKKIIQKISDVDKLCILEIAALQKYLSKYFSLVSVDDNSRPFDNNWKQWCYEKNEFCPEEYFNYNAAILCGPASGLLVLEVYDELLFSEYKKNKFIEFNESNYVCIETFDGKLQYYFKYPNDSRSYNCYEEKFSINGTTIVPFRIIGCEGYVLAPGSSQIYIQRKYTVKNNAPLVDAPNWILNLCAETKIDQSTNVKVPINFPAQKETEIKQSAEERFKNHFDNTIGWGITKEINKWTHPTEAFEKANYLLFPKSRRKYMCFDLDWEGSATIWEDLGLPKPTIIIVNRENGHSNTAYELEKEVYWPCGTNINKISTKPVDYFKAISRGYTRKLDADYSYTNSSFKNPFSNLWKVTWNDVKYDLAYLSEFVIISNKIEYYNRLKKENFVGRNEELFYTARKWSYTHVKHYENYEIFRDSLKTFLIEHNCTKIIEHWPQRGQLCDSEVNTITRNVAKWVWQRKDDKDFSKYIKNFGIMRFETINYELDHHEMVCEIYKRQSAGAYHTHKIRVEKTLNSIKEVVYKLLISGGNTSYRNIANVSGLGYRTIIKYKEYIEHFKNNFLGNKS